MTIWRSTSHPSSSTIRIKLYLFGFCLTLPIITTHVFISKWTHPEKQCQNTTAQSTDHIKFISCIICVSFTLHFNFQRGSWILFCSQIFQSHLFSTPNNHWIVLQLPWFHLVSNSEAGKSIVHVSICSCLGTPLRWYFLDRNTAKVMEKVLVII